MEVGKSVAVSSSAVMSTILSWLRSDLSEIASIARHCLTARLDLKLLVDSRGIMMDGGYPDPKFSGDLLILVTLS